MMKALFYIISLFPKPLFVNLLDIYLYTRIYYLFSSFKITKVNLQIAYPELSQQDIQLLSKLSIKESIISGYETIYTWGRKDYETNSKIFRIENNFLLNKLHKKK
jgi:KDO2-lipid IV(A) lauroyltransferase